MVRMQPVAPIGWPSEMPLPLGFTRSAGSSRLRHTATAWAAKASLTSNTSMSFRSRPVFLRTACVAGVEPKFMGIGPVPAVKALLKKTGFGLKDIDVFEVNEAFAAQALAVVRSLELPADRTNPNGSGISLGHPIGATGCILTIKALYELKRTGGRRALVTMCIGGGQGIAAIFERV